MIIEPILVSTIKKMCYNLYKLAYVLKRIIYLACYLIISKVNVIY